MNVRNTLEEFFCTHGAQIVIDGAVRRGILNPRNETDGNRSRLRMEELGAVRRGDWLLMVSPDAVEIAAGARLTADGRSYIVRMAETYHLAGEPLYRYAVLECPADTSKELT